MLTKIGNQMNKPNTGSYYELTIGPVIQRAKQQHALELEKGFYGPGKFHVEHDYAVSEENLDLIEFTVRWKYKKHNETVDSFRYYADSFTETQTGVEYTEEQTLLRLLTMFRNEQSIKGNNYLRTIRQALDFSSGHWQFARTPYLLFDRQEFEGFVYKITNNVTKEKYIGQKSFWKTITRPPLKGKKRKRRERVESDWQTYTGSSKRLNQDIEEYGRQNFTFEICRLCQTKWELNYQENKMIYAVDAIPREDFYNEYVGRIGRCPASNRIE